MRQFLYDGLVRALAIASLQVVVAMVVPLSLLMIIGFAGLLLVPITLPVWLVVVAWVLRAPTPIGLMVVRGANLLSLGIGGLLCAFGKHCLDAAERSAQLGGGLLGAYGLLPIVLGVVIIIACALSLLLLWSVKPVSARAA